VTTIEIELANPKSLNQFPLNILVNVGPRGRISVRLHRPEGAHRTTDQGEWLKE
jgi:hypothetical protein